MSLAILSGRIYTGFPEKKWVSALYAEKGRIVKIGSDAEIKRLCHDKTQVLKLPDQMVTPGFIDAHCHFISSGLAFQEVQLNHLSLDDCLDQIRQAVQKTPIGEWVTGRGWNHSFWDNPIEPDKSILDQIAPNHPVAMMRVCSHSIWVNSKALELAGIDLNTQDPKGGKIDRDINGEATGIIRESLDLIFKAIPPLSDRQYIKAALAAQENTIQHGITSLRTMEDLECYQLFQELEQDQKLKLRVCHCLPPDDIEKANQLGIQPGKGSDFLWHQHLKIFADGSLGANTALMHEPYTNQPEVSGLACLSVKEMQEYTEFAYFNNRSIAIHAIGDLAVSNAILAIEGARNKHPGFGRDTIEHVQIFKPSDLDRFKALGLTASIQPIFLPTDWQTASAKWGGERCLSAYAWKSIIDSGTPYAFGSDHPIESNNPLLGIQAALTRQDWDHQPEKGWHPSQRLDLETCIKGYTHFSANALGQARNLGSLQPGKWADMAVWDQDLFSTPDSAFKHRKTLKTIINGEIVYQSD
jgi:predicted amidohydrolase YtcJ